MDFPEASSSDGSERDRLPTPVDERVPAWGTVVSLVHHVPGGRRTITFLSDAERTVVRAVFDHLRDLVAIDQPLPATDRVEDPATPHSLLRSLFDRSMYNTPEQSRAEIAMALLRSLVPDEARIFAALSDGSPYALMNIAEPGVVGSATTTLDNASTVGRAAGVSLPDLTPLYLTRMRAAHLVEIGPESPDLRDDYELLLTDASVHAAITEASRGIRPARIIRLSVRISDFGRHVWEATK